MEAWRWCLAISFELVSSVCVHVYVLNRFRVGQKPTFVLCCPSHTTHTANACLSLCYSMLLKYRSVSFVRTTFILLNFLSHCPFLFPFVSFLTLTVFVRSHAKWEKFLLHVHGFRQTVGRSIIGTQRRIQLCVKASWVLERLCLRCCTHTQSPNAIADCLTKCECVFV